MLSEALSSALGRTRDEARAALDTCGGDLAREGHHYYRNFKSENGAVHKQRHKRLMREFKTFLRDGLPADLASSIAVRVDEDHPQMAKAIIAGVQGTPYDSGLFEFDIYVPPAYPNCPPKVNLMNSGKVCLSVLGTWDGPGWDSEQSSLWQVLLSIQS